MKIRSITYFCNPEWPINEEILHEAGIFIEQAIPAFEAAGYEVQTSRMATIPFPRMVVGWDERDVVELAQKLEQEVKNHGFDYVSLGPAFPQIPESYQVIPEVLASTELVFISGVMDLRKDGIDLQAVRACADVICQSSTITPDGFSNLRFAALANVPAGAPFFPAAYHAHSLPDGSGPVTFALAIQAADLAVDAFSDAKDLREVQIKLTAMLNQHGKGLEKVADMLSEQNDVEFGGIDFSLAPYPVEECSIGAAMERFGVPAVGMHGSLAATSILTNALDQARFKRTGFCGVMLPVLEDSTLAASTERGILDITDLLLYSAVCGTGLDTIPLPGDVTSDQIAASLLDLAVLALRLDKPLTARLMPIPGKQAGDLTSFDFEYFANSRVLALNAEPLQRFFAGDGVIELHKRWGIGFQSSTSQ
jgi:uncharacterized protein (UPF0210 family)